MQTISHYLQDSSYLRNNHCIPRGGVNLSPNNVEELGMFLSYDVAHLFIVVGHSSAHAVLNKDAMLSKPFNSGGSSNKHVLHSIESLAL